MMEIKDYVEAVRVQVEVDLHGEAETMVYFKPVPNGTMAGIVIKPLVENIAPTIYVDDLWKKGVSIVDASTEVIKRFNAAPRVQTDIRKMADFVGFVQDRLEVRLYPNTMGAEVSISAEKFGFDDLILVPYVDIDLGNGYKGSAPVTNQLLTLWKVTAEDVVEIALENMKEKVEMETMADFMSKATNTPISIWEQSKVMWILSTKSHSYGAVAVISMQDKLKEKFPSGYVVIPSSIHEVLVIPKDAGLDNCYMDSVINIVNDEEVPSEERLGNKHYLIA